MYSIYIYIFSEKNLVYRDRTNVPTCQKVTRLPLSYRGDRSMTSKVEVNFADVCGFDTRPCSPELQQVRLPVRFPQRRLGFSLNLY